MNHPSKSLYIQQVHVTATARESSAPGESRSYGSRLLGIKQKAMICARLVAIIAVYAGHSRGGHYSTGEKIEPYLEPEVLQVWLAKTRSRKSRVR